MRLHQRLRREQGRHTDDWLITYADTITLLLCLFVVILSMKTGEKSAPREVTPPVVHAAGATDIFAGQPPFPPVARVIDLAAADSDGAERPFAGVQSATIEATIIQVPTPPPVAAVAVLPEAPETSAFSTPEAAVTRTPAAAVTRTPAVVGPLKFQGTNIVEQRGDRITTLRINSAAFFGSGLATISAAGSVILREVAITLKSNDFAAYRIAIEGHTDDTPISTGQFQSNWELSTARAAAVVRFLLEQGISPGKLTAAGYADTFPIAPNRNAEGVVIPENQALNRRVVIRLEKIDDRN